jgi:hypothetical protein
LQVLPAARRRLCFTIWLDGNGTNTDNDFSINTALFRNPSSLPAAQGFRENRSRETKEGRKEGRKEEMELRKERRKRKKIKKEDNTSLVVGFALQWKTLRIHFLKFTPLSCRFCLSFFFFFFFPFDKWTFFLSPFLFYVLTAQSCVAAFARSADCCTARLRRGVRALSAGVHGW